MQYIGSAYRNNRIITNKIWKLFCFCIESAEPWMCYMEEVKLDFFETINYRVLNFMPGLFHEFYMSMCGIEQCLPGLYAGPFERPGYHLHVVVSGKGTLTCDGVDYDVKAGDFFLTVPGHVFSYRADEKEPWYYCWITYDGTLAADNMKLAGFSEGRYVLPNYVDASQYLLILEEILKYPYFNLESDMYCEGLACQFFSLVLRSSEKGSLAPAPRADLTADDYIRFSIEYMQENYPSAKIDDLARYIGISRSYLSTIFKQKMLISPQEYLMGIRVTKAKELLEQTDYPIGWISAKIGYDNQMTFSKMFHRKAGLSPEQYRRRFKENKERQ